MLGRFSTAVVFVRIYPFVYLVYEQQDERMKICFLISTQEASMKGAMMRFYDDE